MCLCAASHGHVGPTPSCAGSPLLPTARHGTSLLPFCLFWTSFVSLLCIVCVYPLCLFYAPFESQLCPFCFPFHSTTCHFCFSFVSLICPLCLPFVSPLCPLSCSPNVFPYVWLLVIASLPSHSFPTPCLFFPGRLILLPPACPTGLQPLSWTTASTPTPWRSCVPGCRTIWIYSSNQRERSHWSMTRFVNADYFFCWFLEG